MALVLTIFFIKKPKKFPKYAIIAVRFLKLSSMKIGIAVLGAGRWGVNLIRNFIEHPDSEVLAVVDPNRDSLVGVQKQFNLHPSVILATNWSQIEALPGLDAVAIATPASTHYTLATATLQQG